MRIERGWSFPRLAQDMRRQGFSVPDRTLHYLTKVARDYVRPRDTTIYRIEKYLERLAAA